MITGTPPNRPHTGDGYNSFDLLATKVRERLAGRRHGGLDLTPSVLSDRIVQRVTEIFLAPFVSWFESTGSNQIETFGSGTVTIADRKCTVDLSSGQLHFSARQARVCWLEFAMLWGKILLFSICFLWRPMKGTVQRCVCLLYGVGSESMVHDGTDKRFAEYLASTPVTPLREAHRVVVDSTENLKSTDERVVYARNPLLFCWKHYHRGPKRFLVFLGRHLVLPRRVFQLVKEFPEVLIVARDLAWLVVVESLDRNEVLNAVVYTSSNCHSQPLWLRGVRHFRLHLVHYSQAHMVHSYKNSPVRSDPPKMRWIRCDDHWVWTSRFGTYIASHDRSAEIHIVGPLIWYPPRPHYEKAEGVGLVVFDRPACSDAVARSWGQMTNFDTAEHLEAFVNDVMRVRTELQEEYACLVKLTLKAKRNHHSYDQRYAKFVSDLGDQQRLQLVSPSENMFDLIAASQIAIVLPYSSPAYVASSIGVPAVFYDPTRTIVPAYEPGPGIYFSSGFDHLKATCDALLGMKRRKPAEK